MSLLRWDGGANANTSQKLHLDYSTPEAPFSLRIDPRTGTRPKCMLTQTCFTSATSLTREGANRNKEQFWQLWKEKYPETLSAKNLEIIQQKLAPKVDSTWIQHFPEHARYF